MPALSLSQPSIPHLIDTSPPDLAQTSLKDIFQKPCVHETGRRTGGERPARVVLAIALPSVTWTSQSKARPLEAPGGGTDPFLCRNQQPSWALTITCSNLHLSQTSASNMKSGAETRSNFPSSVLQPGNKVIFLLKKDTMTFQLWLPP